MSQQKDSSQVTRVLPKACSFFVEAVFLIAVTTLGLTTGCISPSPSVGSIGPPPTYPSMPSLKATGAVVPSVPDSPPVTPVVSSAEIVFRANQGERSGLFSVRADGSNLTEILSLPGSLAGAIWAPDFSRVLLTYRPFYFETGAAKRYSCDVYLADVQDGTLTRLSDRGNCRGSGWSPNASLVAYECSSADALEEQIYLLDLESGQERLLAGGPGRNIHFGWSPDGSRLFFASDSEEDRIELYAIGSDGSERTKLTNTGFDKSWFALSPDGTRILFVGATRQGEQVDSITGLPDTDYRLFVMNADGTEMQQLPVEFDVSFPTWSPGGDRIVFSGGNSNFGVYVIDVEGTNLTLLSAGGGSLPSWSPDGTKVALIRGYTSICVLDVASSIEKCFDTGLSIRSSTQWVR